MLFLHACRLFLWADSSSRYFRSRIRCQRFVRVGGRHEVDRGHGRPCFPSSNSGAPSSHLPLVIFWYRADWEPEATSGKSMAGVPGVFWRCPAVLQGPSTHNPTLVAGKTLILKNWLIFPICMWKWGGSAPSGQARVSRPNWPQCAKSHAAWQSLSSRAEKLRIFSKIFFFHFLTIFF
jgi:hypothetical protein